MKKMILLAAMFGLAAALTAKGADAKENWDSLCAKCHGANGKGDTKMGQKLGAKDFTDAKYQASMKDEEMLKAMKDGVKDGEKVRMKAVEGLSDDDMKALVKFVRDFKK